MSCPTTTFCVAVDTAGNAYTYNGSTWTATPIDAANLTLYSVSCPSSSFCAAIDNVENLLMFNGEARQIPTGSEIDALLGSLRIVTATGQVGKTQTATLTGGIFKVTQDRTGITKGLTDLNLVESAFPGAPT